MGANSKKRSMPNLVTRFHLLIFGVTLAMAGVVLVNVPASYVFPMHWQGSAPDWIWPRDLALAVAPLVQLVLMFGFFILGRSLTANHMAKTRHILDPSLTLLLTVAAGWQLGLLFLGIGSDLDLVRGTTGLLAAILLVLAVVVFEAERHTYAGIRMPWPIVSDRAWRIVHRTTGVASGVAALVLAGLAWQNPGPGPLILAMGASLVALPAFAGLITLLTRRF